MEIGGRSHDDQAQKGSIASSDNRYRDTGLELFELTKSITDTTDAVSTDVFAAIAAVDTEHGTALRQRAFGNGVWRGRSGCRE